MYKYKHKYKNKISWLLDTAISIVYELTWNLSCKTIGVYFDEHFACIIAEVNAAVTFLHFPTPLLEQSFFGGGFRISIFCIEVNLYAS